MKDFRLYELSPGEFERTVGHICMHILGTGVVVFSEGPDGGRDGQFEGTANKYPSGQSPWSGKFIIQAKVTHNPIASCADSEFSGTGTSSVLSKEIPRIKRLKDNGEVDNYLLFTSRKLPGEEAAGLKQRIKDGTGVRNVAILGSETVSLHLVHAPEIAKICGLDALFGPLRLSPEDLKAVIVGFHDNPNAIPDESSRRYSFPYLETQEKNERNQLGQKYFEYIKASSESYFHDIKVFLGNPINSDLAEKYYDIADDFNSKLTIRRDHFGAFEEIFEVLYEEIISRLPDLRPRRLIRVFLHYMYCNCDIGDR